MKASRIGVVVVLAALGAGVAGCAATKVSGKHPLVQGAAGAATSTVYFLRPEPERRMGFSDNPLTIEVNQELMLRLGRGEYTAVNIAPREVVLTLRNRTEAGPFWAVKELERQYTFKFAPGETYYLVVRPVDGEFRGVFFKPESVDLYTAQQVAARLHSVGARLPVTKP